MTHQYPRSRFGGNPSLDLSLDLSFSLSLIRSAAACPMKLLPVAVVLVALVVLLTGATLTLQGSGPRGELEEEQEERLSYALLPFQEDEAVDGDEDVADRLSHLTTQISTPSVRFWACHMPRLLLALSDGVYDHTLRGGASL